MPAAMPSDLRKLLLLVLLVPALACDNAVEPLADAWDLPERPVQAPPATELLEAWESLSLEDRDARIVEQVLSGNVPSWLRKVRTLSLERVSGGDWVPVEIGVLPDYLAVGSDDDHMLVPMSPQAAQRIAEATGMMLPTTMLVDEIWSQAEIRLAPRPIPPTPAMTTLPVFHAHFLNVDAQRDSLGVPVGAWVAGHKKDVVLAGKLEDASGRVAIYGWHRTNGQPIQPLYTGHTDRWVDYSHGIRLVTRSIRIDGKEADLKELLEDASRARWFMADGPMTSASYSTIGTD